MSMSVMTNPTRSCFGSATMAELPQGFQCDPAEMRPAPIRWPMRLYMRVGGVQANEALNCNCAPAELAPADIADCMKRTMNRWQAWGLNLETGRVDYERLARSPALDELRPLAAALRDFDPAVLTTVNQRKAFWINLYNVLLIHGVIAYGARTSLWNIRGAFERFAYMVGGYRYSLDDIEHGILRRNRAHFLIPGVRFSRRDPRRSQVMPDVDARIHFALVCGASSCPPIGVYQADKLDEQLDVAARNFINGGGVIVNSAESSAYVSRIFQWYSRDFGGKWMGIGNRAPILLFIARYLDGRDGEYLSSELESVRLRYQHYDWALNV